MHGRREISTAHVGSRAIHVYSHALVSFCEACWYPSRSDPTAGEFRSFMATTWRRLDHIKWYDWIGITFCSFVIGVAVSSEIRDIPLTSLAR